MTIDQQNINSPSMIRITNNNIRRSWIILNILEGIQDIYENNAIKYTLL